jgi:hypothetical protein
MAAAISEPPKESFSDCNTRRSVAIAQKSCQPSAAERQASPDSGIRMRSVR